MDDDARKAAEKKAREDAWWEAWWAEDFSWDGLADKPWRGWSVTPDGKVIETADAPEGSRAATRQDYYRWDTRVGQLRDDEASPLVKTEGQPVFHILHLPPRYKDGTESWKSDLEAAEWTALETEAARLVAEGARTEFGILEPTGADRRSQLHGAVLRAFPRPPAPSTENTEPPATPSLHLIANFAAFLGDCAASGLEFSSAAGFAACGFFGDAYFRNAQFSGGDADFENAQFSGGDANFYNAQFSGGYADFNNAQFSGGYADFENAQFSGGDANFYNAQFSGGYADFNNAQFSGGYAYFYNAQFSGGFADFNSAQFSGGDADFKNAQFSGGYADFENAQFSGGDAYFYNAQFSGGDADFSGILALSGLDFTRGRQGPQEAGKIEAVPSDDAPGETRPVADYSIHLTTPDAQAAMGAFRGFNFSGARCFGPVNFSDRRFSQAPDFSGARFFDRVEFHGASLHEGVDLTEARFKFDSDRAFEPPALADVLEELRARADVEVLPEEVHKLAEENYQSAIERFNDPSHEAARFESAYRTLKQLTAGIGARTEEQRFFALELKARQARTDSDVRVWEKRFAALYGAMSDYGQSLTRPFWWLVRLSTVMAAVYIALNLTAPTPPGTEARPWPVASSQDRLATRHTRAVLAQQAGYIASRVFKPGPIVYSIEMTAIPLIDPSRHHPWARALSGEGASEAAPGLHPYLFALARLVHRILALPLIFLFLLTLRRRFQIS